ncbi:MAG: GNAT family protein [Anaerolineaceae bacterium]|nr:GNAT family protein [Anaerolineaceae bacterium]
MPGLTIPQLFPRLETERLMLREITRADRESVFRIYSDEMVTDTLTIPPLKSLYESENLIIGWDEQFEHKQGIRWGVIDKDENCLIGTCGYQAWQRSMRGEIGYDLGRACWGKGLMGEALNSILAYGFEEVGLNRIEAFVDPANDRSIHLLNRMGFRREGLLREYGYWKGRFWDQICYAMLKREWQVISIQAEKES